MFGRADDATGCRPARRTTRRTPRLKTGIKCYEAYGAWIAKVVQKYLVNRMK